MARPFRAFAAGRLSQVLADRGEDDLLRLAVERGLLTPDQVRQTRAEQASAEPRRAIALILKDRGWIPDADLTELTRSAGHEAVARLMMSRSSDLPEAARLAAADPTRNLDEFVLVEIAGHGASGDVWKAWDRQLGRWVALKIAVSRPGSVQVWERFRREILAAAKLVHPNIVPIHRVAEHEGRPYIVMRLVEGRMLGEVSLPVDKAVQVVRQAALAVHYAHQEGVVHRDLKPSNIMVDESGTVWLLDFGLAFLQEGGQDLTATGAILGTPAYMSPEQARSATEAREPASDIYSLGATLYELVTGRRPFDGASAMEIVQQVMFDDPVPPRTINPKIPADVETIIMRAMDKDAARRYRSAADFAEDLRRHLDGEPIAARPASWTYRFVRRVRRHSGAAGLTAAAVATVVAILLGVWVKKSLDETSAAAKASNLLEAGRPALDQALMVLKRPDADLDELLRRVDLGQKKIEEAIELSPKSALAHHLLGRAWDLKGRDDLAEASWRKAIELDPGFGPAHYQLGRLLLERAALGMLIDEWDAASPPTSSQPLAGAASREIEAAIAAGGTLDDDLQRSIAGIIVTLLKPDPVSAGRDADEALKRFPSQEGLEELWMLKGLALPEQGAACFDKALALRPQYPLALLLRGILHVRRGEFDPAVERYTNALRLRPRLMVALLCRGRAKLAKGDAAGAIDDVSAAIRREPASSHAYAARSGMRFQLGEFDGAIADADQAIHLDPALSGAFANRSQAKVGKGDLAGATKDADECVRLAPDSANPYAVRAVVRMTAGDLKGAMDDCEAALRRNPRCEPALLNRGVLHARSGNLEAAARDFNDLIAMNPRYAQTFMSRGFLRVQLQEFKGAMEDYDRAIELDQRFAVAHFNRGILHAQLGDLKAALQDYDRAIDANPRFADAFLLRAQLKSDAGDRDGAASDASRAIEVAPPGWPYRPRANQVLQANRNP